MAIDFPSGLVYYANLLHNMRKNIYRDKIVRVLSRHHLLSITNIQKYLPKVDYSTIYRNVEQLVADGELRKIVVGDGGALYELSGASDDHGHFLCLDCGDIESTQTANMSVPVSRQYVIKDILIKGLCGKCNLNHQ